MISANDIVDVISRYVRLEKKSSQNLFGLCPFHDEKTPSFSVSPGKQIFYCFGCHKGGNVIKFIQEIEHLSFPEAIHLLAERAGIAIEESEEDSEWRDKRERERAAAEALLEAARFYHSTLESPAGLEARRYLEKRGVDQVLRRRYGLGYAPERGDALQNALRERGIPANAMLDAGLIARSSRGESYYDFFRHRVLFPIIDARGKVLAFGGRAIREGGPKYINSPDTIVYQKGRHLFGWPQAVNANQRTWFLVEGYMDVIALAKAGIYQAVAPLGTALTTYQARSISRHVDRVIILMDSDRAGREAALRAQEIFESIDVPSRFVLLKEAKDPDEYFSKFGCERLTAALSRSLDKTEYRLALLKTDADSVIGVPSSDYRNQAINILSKENDGVKREIYGGRLAKELQLNARVLQDEIERRRASSSEQEETAPVPGPPGTAINQPRKRVSTRLKGSELFLLTLLTFDHTLAKLRPELSESKWSGYMVPDEVKAILLSDEAARPLSPDDFNSEFMRLLAEEVIGGAGEGELTLAALDAQIGNTRARLAEKDSLPQDETGQEKTDDELHAMLMRLHLEITDSRMTKEEMKEVFLHRLALLRIMNWDTKARYCIQEAHELELSGEEKKAKRRYAEAASLTMAAQTFRMLIQGE